MGEVSKIALEDCVYRGVYAIYSRNLHFGVFDGKQGFVGVREKFGPSDRFLFTEYHWAQGPPFGTVNPFLFLGMLPEEIEVREYYDQRTCWRCKVPLEVLSTDPMPPSERYRHMEPTDCDDPRASITMYRPLFDYLELFERFVNWELLRSVDRGELPTCWNCVRLHAENTSPHLDVNCPNGALDD